MCRAVPRRRGCMLRGGRVRVMGAVFLAKHLWGGSGVPDRPGAGRGEMGNQSGNVALAELVPLMSAA